MRIKISNNVRNLSIGSAVGFAILLAVILGVATTQQQPAQSESLLTSASPALSDAHPAFPKYFGDPVTLTQARAKVNFTIAVPSYLPANTTLEVVTTWGYGVILYYDKYNLRIIEVPEPGVTGPPPGIPGTYTTLKGYPALFSLPEADPQQVHWWMGGVHYNVVGELPLGEIIKIAEST